MSIQTTRTWNLGVKVLANARHKKMPVHLVVLLHVGWTPISLHDPNKEALHAITRVFWR
jgi:hypothetical protein